MAKGTAKLLLSMAGSWAAFPAGSLAADGKVCILERKVEVKGQVVAPERTRFDVPSMKISMLAIPFRS